MSHKPLKIAIVRLSAMGDIIYAAFVLAILHQELKNHNRTVAFHWFVDSRFSDILQNCPYVDKIHTLPLGECLKTFNLLGIWKIYRQLRKEKFDYVLDPQGLLKSALVAKSIPSKNHVGFSYRSAREKLASFFYNRKINIAYREHIILRNAKILFYPFAKELKFSPSLTRFNNIPVFLGYSTQDSNSLQSILSTFHLQLPKILFVLETSKQNKNYSIANFTTLAKLLNKENITPLILYHKDLEGAKQIANQAKVILLPQITLDIVKPLIAQMDLVIGGDTGITHLAWAFRRPSITLFGVTPSERIGIKTPINLNLSGSEKVTDRKIVSNINSISPTDINSIEPQNIFNLSKEILSLKNPSSNLPIFENTRNTTILKENKLKAWFIKNSFMGIGKLFYSMPHSMRVRIAKTIAWILRMLDKRRIKDIESNLKFAYQNALSIKTTKEIIQSCYFNLVYNTIIFLMLPHCKREDFLKNIDVENAHYAATYIKHNKGAIFVTAHFGNWEYASLASCIFFDTKVKALWRPTQFPFLNKLIQENRENFGVTLVDKKGATKELIGALQKNEYIGIVNDQNASSKDGILVDFFGKKVSQSATPAILSRRFQMPIIPVFVRYSKDYSRQILTFYPPILPIKSQDSQEDIQTLSQAQSDAFETVIKQYPNQWFWFHKKFKNQYPEIYSQSYKGK